MAPISTTSEFDHEPLSRLTPEKTMNTDRDGLSVPGPSPSVTAQGMAGVENHSSDIFFSAVETTRMPMILTDPQQTDNPIVFANQAFLTMTGYTAAEVVGHNCRFLQGAGTDPDTVADIRRGIAAAEQVSVEILNYRKDGTSFWNALFISPVFDRTGRLVYFFASQLDVSQRKAAEKALRQSQKMEAVGQLTGGIAHDFNNLLQVISGAVDLLKKQDGVAANAKTMRLVNAMDDAARRASTLTQQLLAFSRKQALEGRVVDINRLIEGMSDLAGRSLGGQATLTYDFDKSIWPSRLDPTQTELALLNLYINARDAMPDGGMITVTTRNVDLSEGHELLFDGLIPGRYINVSVADTGTGIPADIAAHVMDPFFTTKEEGKGTGLGLSMVYGFAKQSGGGVRISSELDHGTTVQLFFPAADEVEKAETGLTARAADRGGHERILVVDDRADVAELARLMLEDAGYAVEVAGGAGEALAKLSHDHAFQLLLTDVIMPGSMNGLALARAARMKAPALKILLMTGYTEPTLQNVDGEGIGFDVIIKPYTHRDLIRKVRMALDGPDEEIS